VPLPLTYGLLVGLAQLAATLVVFALGLHGSAEGLDKAQMPESLVGFILLMLILGLAHRQAKARALAAGGDLAFGQAAKFFALIAVLGGALTGLGQWLYLAFINPGLREIQRAKILENAAAELAKLPPEQAADITQKIDFATSAVARGVVYGVNTLLFALLLGIAYALIFRAAARRDTKVQA
jgi:hypothetical protein